MDFDAEQLGISSVISLSQYLPTGDDMQSLAAFMKRAAAAAAAQPAAVATAGAAAADEGGAGAAGGSEPAAAAPAGPKLGKAEEYLLAMSKVRLTVVRRRLFTCCHLSLLPSASVSVGILTSWYRFLGVLTGCCWCCSYR